MATKQIDYSGIPSGNTLETQGWEPPPHVYFGPKDPNTGKMLREPVYVYQEYPRMMYKDEGDRVLARVVNSDAERDALGKGWVKTPGECGIFEANSKAEEAERQRYANAGQREDTEVTALLQEAARNAVRRKG